MKYVIFTDGMFAIIPDMESHDSVVKYPHCVLSAGFCRIESYRDKFDDVKYTVSCWGGSTSLGIEANEVEDAKIIAMYLK